MAAGLLLHDDALIHSAMVMTCFLANCGVFQNNCLLFYLALQQSTFLFPEVKTTFTEEDFKCSGYKKNVTTKLNAVPFYSFHECVIEVLERYKKCVAVKGITLAVNKIIFFLCLIGAIPLCVIKITVY
jgi:hypothetical protein